MRNNFDNIINYQDGIENVFTVKATLNTWNGTSYSNYYPVLGSSFAYVNTVLVVVIVTITHTVLISIFFLADSTVQ